MIAAIVKDGLLALERTNTLAEIVKDDISTTAIFFLLNYIYLTGTLRKVLTEIKKLQLSASRVITWFRKNII